MTRFPAHLAVLSLLLLARPALSQEAPSGDISEKMRAAFSSVGWAAPAVKDAAVELAEPVAVEQGAVREDGTFESLAADAYDVRRILRNGGSVVVGDEFDESDIRGFIRIGEHRVSVRCDGFDEYDCKRFARDGASLILDSSYDRWEVEDLIEEVETPATATVKAEGFDRWDLDRFKRLGAVIEGLPEEEEGDYFEYRRILRDGGSVIVGSELDEFDIRRLIRIGKDRVTVDCSGFDYFDARRFAREGASLKVGEYFSSSEVRRLIDELESPAAMTVVAEGFSDYELRRFAEMGAEIEY